MNAGSVIEYIERKSLPLRQPNDLQAIVDAVGDAQIVLLGEASHGTAEFYTQRAEISKKLIEQKGFRFIGVEGDWPSCYEINRFVKRYPGAAQSPEEALQDFNRWPTWMWANREIMPLIQWIRDYNDRADNKRKVGFYGIDVYSLWESLDAIMRYAKETGSEEIERMARAALECFDPHGREGQAYGLAAALYGEGCKDEVVQLLTEMQQRRQRQPNDDEAALSAEINSLVSVNAERYYRSMITHDGESWNVRDRHMVEALTRVQDFYGPDAKAIVWEHNTHIGDARATDMAAEGMVNVGQLLREQHGRENVFAVGFGTHRGTVIAGQEWGAPAERMVVPPGRPNSWEDMLHEAGGGENRILLIDRQAPELQQRIRHRAIGVVYHPRFEAGNYVPSIMGERYDAFIHIDESSALEPLEVAAVYS
ncbi:erythromycin esterase family protein [Paenibacillus xerothermodurans]|uniref:Erythromycin esterase family protein n=2 Tax=Paenibacillus xerothermodurans TaxID=1977292 RepID=A0A2W1N868_PAEXE|nr:erythromycin esterase family protein [Paenibacillus xerothermodurans]